MRSWAVQAINRANGQERVIPVVAATEAEARTKANDLGYLAGRVEPMAEAEASAEPPSIPTPNVPPSRDARLLAAVEAIAYSPLVTNPKETIAWAIVRGILYWIFVCICIALCVFAGLLLIGVVGKVFWK